VSKDSMPSPAEQNIAARTTSPAQKRGRLRLRILLLLVAIGLTIGVAGYWRIQTGPAGGEGVHGTLPTLTADKTIFRIGTLNMHSGVGEDDVYNLNRTIEAVRGCDLCALNEVRGRLFGQPANQAQELAQATGGAWLYLPSERRFWHDDFGNGLLTRIPIAHWIRTPLPTEPHHGGYRNVTIATAQLGSQSVRLLITHIDRDIDQSNQLRFITTLFSSLEQPALLLGDLNATSDNREIQALLSVPGVHDCFAEATGQTRGRIDWILSRGLKTVWGDQIKNGASDHPMYWVDLTHP